MYTDEQLLDKLKELSEILGKYPSHQDMERADGFPDPKAYRNHFGTWANAKRLVDFPVYKQKFKPLKRKSKIYDGRLVLRFRVFERDKFRCQYCGAEPRDGAKLHLDHIIPLSEGGHTLIKNLITSCEDCNYGKRDRILENYPKMEVLSNSIH